MDCEHCGKHWDTDEHPVCPNCLFRLWNDCDSLVREKHDPLGIRINVDTDEEADRRVVVVRHTANVRPRQRCGRYGQGACRGRALSLPPQPRDQPRPLTG